MASCQKLWAMGAAAFGVLRIGGLAASAAQVPIPLNASSFNQDVVVEATASHPPAAGAITQTMDGTTAAGKYTWYETGYDTNTNETTTGLPHPGTIVSNADANTTYTLPAYTANNVAYLSGATTATLTLTTPAKYSTLSFLTSTGAGTGTISYTVNFSDGATAVTGTVGSPDWFGNTPVAVTANGRVDSAGSFNSVNTGNPRLYQEDVTLPASAFTHPISSIGVSNTGGGNTAIFAVSGTSVPEPAALGTLGLGALGLLARRRRAV